MCDETGTAPSSPAPSGGGVVRSSPPARPRAADGTVRLPAPRWRWVEAPASSHASVAHAVPTLPAPTRPATPPPGGLVGVTAACGLMDPGWVSLGGAMLVRQRCPTCWRLAFDTSLAAIGPEGVLLAYHLAGCETSLGSLDTEITADPP